MKCFDRYWQTDGTSVQQNDNIFFSKNAMIDYSVYKMPRKRLSWKLNLETN